MIQAKEGGYEAIDEPDTSRRRFRCGGSLVRFTGASLAILAAIISWVIMAEKLQKVNKVYHKPFFITYWVHGFGYSMLYVAWQFWLVFPGNLSCNRVGEGVWKGRSRQLLILSGVLAAVSFSSAFAWYYSLPRTNIPANTSIYQSACVWVFLLSIVLLRERVTVLKVGAVIISVVGIVLVAVFSNTCNNMHKMAINETDLLNSTTYSGHMLGHIHRGGSCTEKSTTSGYIALLYSVISYAVFEVSYKKWGSEEHDRAAIPNSVRVIGYMGVHTLAWFWPLFFVLHYSGVEPFEWPPGDILVLLIWNAFLDIVFNGGLLICIALSSALFASVGTVLVIPAAILVDLIFQGFLLSVQASFGVVLIIIGFIGFVVSEVVAMVIKQKSKEIKVHDTRHLQSPHDGEDDGTWEEGEGKGEERGEKTALLLRKGRRRRPSLTILKYLF